MRWRRVRSSPVTDRRSMGTPVRAGGGIGVLVALIAAILFGTNVVGGDGSLGGVESPFDTFPEQTGAQYGDGRAVPGAPDPQAELADFVRFVSADVQNFWQQEFAEGGQDYDPAEVVLFRSRVQSGCGAATAAVGPFYCPVDQAVYLDLSFFDDLERRFGAPGDFAQAYVIAHEFGHHVQLLTGVMGDVERSTREDPGLANQLSVRQELQADCLAGVWGHSTYERGLLETGDYEEGLGAAAAVGDDRLQRQSTGRVVPETFTHGSSEQRTGWFSTGFESGDAAACDTFGGKPLD